MGSFALVSGFGVAGTVYPALNDGARAAQILVIEHL